ncbi:MAG: hypothetical protein WCQ72_01490 [Eubacteriales bacterium]
MKNECRLVLAAVCAALITALASCGDIPRPAQDTFETQDTAAANGALRISAADAEGQTLAVVRSDTSGRALTDEAVRLRKAVEQCIGTDVIISTDWKKNPTYAVELIVGETLREASDGSDIDRVSLGERGWAVIRRGSSVFITGGSDETTGAAVDAFISAFIDGAENGEIVIPDGYEDIHRQNFDIPELYIAGEPSRDYPIVCAEGDDAAAERLRDAIYSKTGVMHEIITGEYEGKAFVLAGEGGVRGTVEVGESGGSLYFEQNCGAGLSACVDSFVSRYIGGAFGAINFPEGFSYIAAGETLIFIG